MSSPLREAVPTPLSSTLLYSVAFPQWFHLSKQVQRRVFKTLDSIKTLEILIKLAAVALTSTAIVAVAGNLNSSQPVTRTIVRISDFTLIEGCLLSGQQVLARVRAHDRRPGVFAFGGRQFVQTQRFLSSNASMGALRLDGMRH
jgi:hypothetical protein